MENARVRFLVSLLADVPEDMWWLSSGERDRVATLRFPKRRADWLLGRWTAKNAIRCYLSQTRSLIIDYPDLEIRSAADGAPEAFLHGSPAPVSFSLSHSGTQGCCVVAPPALAVGCDLEMIQSHGSQFIDDYLRIEEKGRIAQAPVEQQPFLRILVWSAKESALKCLREGLRRDTRSVNVEFSGEGSLEWNPLAVHCLETSRRFHGWWRREGAYVLTVTAEAHIARPLELVD
jgi:4'-phosphopantetheinyl transferase